MEIVFQSTNLLNASDEHSMYLHGHKFYVVGEGYGNFNSTTDPETYNVVDPPYLSSASLPVKGWLSIRFKANNPGTYLFYVHHFHLNWQMLNMVALRNLNFLLLLSTGVWAMHCQEGRHLIWGMNTVIIVKMEAIQKQAYAAPLLICLLVKVLPFSEPHK